MTNTETFDEKNPYLQGDFPTFHQYLDQHKDWVKASEERDQAGKTWRLRQMPTHKMFRAACYAQAAEMLHDRTVTYYEACMDNEEAELIQRWTGTNPEISVEYYQEIVVVLQKISMQYSRQAVAYQKKTKELEAVFNEKQAIVSELFDSYRVKYNKLQKAKKQAEEEKGES